MRYLASDLRLSIDDDIGNIKDQLWRKTGMGIEDLKDFRIVKEAVDARRKNRIELVYTIEFSTERRLKGGIPGIKMMEEEAETPEFKIGTTKLESRPIVIGTGPAGMFAGLVLARNGYRPLLLERGPDVDERAERLDRFWSKGELDSEGNVQFGEGGAGTFSDGKLTTRINDKRVSAILKEFVKAGAPPEISYKAKPHIGTDILRDVIKNIRKDIIRYGGEVRFKSRVEDIFIDYGLRVQGVRIKNEIIDSQVIVLATGHSARNIYELLHRKNVKLISKPFSIGVRIEHPQELIDRAQHGSFAGHPRLGHAEYQLSYKLGQRAAYTFCMCPGGLVVAASSDQGEVVTNGMSYHARDGINANSAFVVSVGPEDFGDTHPLAGIEFQRMWERAAFQAGGGRYYAPVQKLGDFLDKRVSTRIGKVIPTYIPGVVPYDLTKCLPGFVVDMMIKAVGGFNRQIKGFAMKDAILTGVETRTSAPVRIVRDSNFEAEGITGLYLAGEGAGYAGGIVSAAVDGMRVAEAVMSKYKNF